MKKYFIVSGIIFMAACTAKKVATTTTAPVEMVQTDADRGVIKYPGLTLEKLNEGKTLYVANCGSCHKLFKPNEHNEAVWNHEVPDMSKKVNKNAGQTVLDEAKQQLILQYLVTMGPDKK